MVQRSDIIVPTYQHRCTNVEFRLELRDEDVRRDEVVLVFVFDLTDDVGQPFEVTLCPRHPQEVDLHVR